MGLFKSKVTASSKYVLPPAGNRDFYKYQRPIRYTAAMMNLGYLEKTMRAGSTPAEFAGRIVESVDWDPDVNLANTPRELALAAFQKSRDVSSSEDAIEAFESAVFFGILAGIYERRSGAMRKGLTHPAIWNALGFMRMSDSESEMGQALSREQQSLASLMPYVGYSQGREPSISVAQVYSNWHAAD